MKRKLLIGVEAAYGSGIPRQMVKTLSEGLAGIAGLCAKGSQYAQRLFTILRYRKYFIHAAGMRLGQAWPKTSPI